MNRRVPLLLVSVLLLCGASALAQTALRLVPLKGNKVKLVYGLKTATVELESEISGTNGSLPGEPPNVYKVLFTTEKDGFLYLVANLRSRSPISDKNAPCGGDRPRAILLIKADELLKKTEVQSEIYESCSYNYYNSKVDLRKMQITIDYGSNREKKHLLYDNLHPENGLWLGIKLTPGTK